MCVEVLINSVCVCRGLKRGFNKRFKEMFKERFSSGSQEVLKRFSRGSQEVLKRFSGMPYIEMLTQPKQEFL